VLEVSTADSALSVDIYSFLRLWSANSLRQNGDGPVLQAEAFGESDAALCDD
jgi:hypothetical protein